MEPEQTPVEQPVSKFENLHKVTPLSKYLSMALFIVLPFLGGWVGYNLAVEKAMVETRKSIETEQVATSEYLTATSVGDSDSLKVQFQTSYEYPDSYEGEKSLFIHFGDGRNTLVRGNVTHTYDSPGEYEVKLMGCNLNNDFLCEEIEVDSLKIEVTPEKVAEVNVDESVTGHYENESLGFSVKYPADWRVNSSQSGVQFFNYPESQAMFASRWPEGANKVEGGGGMVVNLDEVENLSEYSLVTQRGVQFYRLDPNANNENGWISIFIPYPEDDARALRFAVYGDEDTREKMLETFLNGLTFILDNTNSQDVVGNSEGILSVLYPSGILSFTDSFTGKTSEVMKINPAPNVFVFDDKIYTGKNNRVYEIDPFSKTELPVEGTEFEEDIWIPSVFIYEDSLYYIVVTNGSTCESPQVKCESHLYQKNLSSGSIKYLTQTTATRIMGYSPSEELLYLGGFCSTGIFTYGSTGLDLVGKWCQIDVTDEQYAKNEEVRETISKKLGSPTVTEAIQVSDGKLLPSSQEVAETSAKVHFY